jgi:hypothetical protein
MSQAPLTCPTSCMNDGQCASTAYCNIPPMQTMGTCTARQPDGGGCTIDDQCAQGHYCRNSHCCSSSTGDCCNSASDCPGKYAVAPICDTPASNSSCQGHRNDKTCVSNVCGTSTNIADDSACTSSYSKYCGTTYKPIACTGAVNQSTPSCPAYCFSDSVCITPANHCYNYACVPWVGIGGYCTANGQCVWPNACVTNTCCSSACNNTACDTCYGGSCSPFSDPYEFGETCVQNQLPDNPNNYSLNAYIQNSADVDDWYYFWATDSFSLLCDGYLRVTLNEPPDGNYQMVLWKWNGTNPACNGSAPTNLNQINHVEPGYGAQGAWIQFNEGCPQDDSGYYFVQIHSFGAYTCSEPYTLTVNAHL